MQYQNLTIHPGSGTDSNGRYTDGFGHLTGKFGWDLFQNYCKTSSLGQYRSIYFQFISFPLIGGPHYIGPKFMNCLGSKAQVPHYRNTGGQNTFNGFLDLCTTFQLNGTGSGLFHDPDGRNQRLL